MFHRNAIAYCGTTVGASMMNTVFSFYYVKLFLNVYKISEWWFNVAQISYLIWNAINDPLFGYIQDTSNIQALKHRRLNILYGAPIYAISFLLPWFSWANDGKPEWLVGVHLIVALCFYDAMLTFVLLAQCSLFAEISREEHERQIVVKYSCIGSIIGSCSIFVCELVVTDLKHARGLQVICILIGLLAWLLMSCSALNVQTVVDRSKSEDPVLYAESKTSMFTLMRQVLMERKFASFVVTNFFQVFHITVCANFFGIFRDHLVGAGVFPPFVLTFIAGSAFVLPQVIVFLSGGILAKFGSYRLIMWSFYIKTAFAVFMYLVGRTHFWLLALFMIADNALSNAAFGLFNLPVSEIIDEDQKIYQRSHPISSTIFGTNALITKPAQSLAPMLVVFILTRYGYQKSSESLTTTSEVQGNEELSGVMFSLLCGVPVILGCLQIAVWRFFRDRK